MIMNFCSSLMLYLKMGGKTGQGRAEGSYLKGHGREITEQGKT